MHVSIWIVLLSARCDSQLSIYLLYMFVHDLNFASVENTFCVSLNRFIYYILHKLKSLFPEILTCPKRCKLIMQVLKITNAKTEAVAMAKLQVWWHFVWLLGPKASANFEQASFHTTRFEFSVREEFLSWFIFIEFQEFFGFHKFFIISMFYISVSIFLIAKSN